MFNLLSASTLLLAAVSSVSGAAVVRRSAPANWATGYLEDYDVYHTRYIALSCQSKHNTAFFDHCCHPLLATENLDTARPAECKPSPSASSSASAVQPSSTVTTPADDLPDCEDADDEVTISAAPKAAATPAPQAAPAPAANPSPAPANPSPAPANPSPAPADPTPAPAPAPAPSPAPEPSPSSSSAPAPAPTDNGAPPPTNNNGNGNNDNNNNGGGEVITGGFATFFDQNNTPGACGTVHQDSDVVAAMDSRRYGSGELCGKQVRITNTQNGKTVVVSVADECPTCVNGNSIDLSHGAFDQIATEPEGIVPISWSFV